MAYPMLAIPDLSSLRCDRDSFLQLVRANPNLRLERTATGELIVNPPTGGTTGRRNRRITGLLDRWIEENPELGEGFDSSTGFLLPNGANRSPDSAWVRSSRWESLTEEERDGLIPLCPDFAVELRSKNDRLTSLREKMQEYLENGMQLGWLIDPKNRQVEIYRRDREVEVLENPRELTGEDLLPGFVLELRKIWG